MVEQSTLRLALGLVAWALSGAQAHGLDQAAAVRRAVDDAVRPVIAEHGIPGLAVAVTIEGRRHFIEYGLASKDPDVTVTRDTLFELGSISKTFTATLAALAEARGKLSLSDSVTQHVRELRGSALDDVRLLDLATHTAGGFPLQVPDEIKSQEQLTAYFRAWTPRFAPGTRRVYANPSIGLLGVATARALGARFEALIERCLLPGLGLRRTYIDVPAAEIASYAWGYERTGKRVRVNPGLLASEAYGVKSNAVDMIRFLELQMDIGTMPSDVARAVKATQVGYFRAGELIQSLIWERYPYPVALEQIVAGNTPATVLGSMPATAIDPPLPSGANVIFNKTGSTNGFGAYAAFVPAKKIGIVILANKNFPNPARVRAAHAVLLRLAD